MNTYRYFVDGNTVKSLNTVPYVLPHHADIIDELADRRMEESNAVGCLTKKANKFESHTDAAFAVGETAAQRFNQCVIRYETTDDFGTTVNYVILEN